MVFEVGKCYQHTTGKMISVVGEVESTMYGKCLIAEQTGNSCFKAVGRDSDATGNWVEVSKEVWLTNFS